MKKKTERRGKHSAGRKTEPAYVDVRVFPHNGKPHVVMVRESADFPGKFGIIGGKPEAGMSLRQVTAMELLEEGGYRVTPDRLKYLGRVNWHGRRVYVTRRKAERMGIPVEQLGNSTGIVSLKLIGSEVFTAEVSSLERRRRERRLVRPLDLKDPAELKLLTTRARRIADLLLAKLAN